MRGDWKELERKIRRHDMILVVACGSFARKQSSMLPCSSGDEGGIDIITCLAFVSAETAMRNGADCLPPCHLDSPALSICGCM